MMSFNLNTNWKRTCLLAGMFLGFFLKSDNLLCAMPGYSFLILFLNFNLFLDDIKHYLINNPFQYISLVYFFSVYLSVSFYLPVSIAWGLIEKIKDKFNNLFLVIIGLISYALLTCIFQICFIYFTVTLQESNDKTFLFLIWQVCIIGFMLFALYVNRDGIKALFTRAFWDWKKIGSEVLQFFVIAIVSGMITCGGIMGVYYLSRLH